MDNKIFRKEALDRVQSPEELDLLFKVVGARAWIPLATLVALCLVGLLWSILGQIPETLQGGGVLINPGRVRNIQAGVSGQLVELNVRPGQLVSYHQLLGCIDDQGLTNRLARARSKLEELQQFDAIQRRSESIRLAHEKTMHQARETLLVKTIADITKLADQTFSANTQNARRQQDKLADSRKEMKQMADEMQRQLSTYRYLESRKVITSDRVLQAKSSTLDLSLRLAEMETKWAELDLKSLDYRDFDLRQKSRIADLEYERNQIELRALVSRQEIVDKQETRQSGIREQQAAVKLLQIQLACQKEIHSPAAGRVLEVSAQLGQVIQPNSRIASMELAEEGTPNKDGPSPLKVLAYFSLHHGKRLRKGLEVLVTPTTVERERYGSILGTVVHVSPFPITEEGALSAVGNAEVVRGLLRPGGVVEVTIELERADTASGFRWTSEGPPHQFTPGTTAAVWITVEKRAPATYVLPVLRSLLSGGNGSEKH